MIDRLGFGLLLALIASPLWGAEFYVSPAGNDSDSGTQEKPFASLLRARDAARQVEGEPITIYLRGGTHYLSEPIVLSAEDSGTKQAPVVYAAYEDETPVISGGSLVESKWEPYKDGIMRAKVPQGFTTDQLFCNGKRQQMARYPNFDPKSQYFNGYSSDCISQQRARRWKDPAGGYFHAMHGSHWGDMHYVITGKNDRGEVQYEGGWQNNRKSSPHGQHRFVENIFEELDAPGEWFLDNKQDLLYFYPPEGVDPNKARIEAVRLEQLFEFRGAAERPVRFIRLKGLTLTHASRTFMKNKEPLLRSDWTTWRGGAVFFEGAEDCKLEELTILEVGSNAVFINNYNRRIEITGCRITAAGASSISFVGNPGALRSPRFNYGQTQTLEQMDQTPGRKTDNYPARCRVHDCLLTLNGRFEKQTAGVNICMSEEITASHCSIYDVPRAGINICDGAFGGHLIEHNDVFDTVKETGDHGSFNSWGRDRFWHPNRGQTQQWLKAKPEMAKWDAHKTTVIRNNRWRCDLGWDIDLDDGSSNYHIYNNLCLSGGIKLREGYHRVVENNVMVNNTFHPHVWYQDCDTALRRNIVWAGYAPPGMRRQQYGKLIDDNFLHVDGARPGPATVLQNGSGYDRNSLTGDAEFIDPAKGDYRVKDGSPAIKLGFKNFPMEGFGVEAARLRKIARTPILPGSAEEVAIVNRGWGQHAVRSPHKQSMKTRWLGAVIKNMQTEGEKSATGMEAIRGVLVVRVGPDSKAARIGLQETDVILALDGQPGNVKELLERFGQRRKGDRCTITVWRQQSEKKLVVGAPARE